MTGENTTANFILALADDVERAGTAILRQFLDHDPERFWHLYSRYLRPGKIGRDLSDAELGHLCTNLTSRLREEARDRMH